MLVLALLTAPGGLQALRDAVAQRGSYSVQKGLFFTPYLAEAEGSPSAPAAGGGEIPGRDSARRSRAHELLSLRASETHCLVVARDDFSCTGDARLAEADHHSNGARPWAVAGGGDLNDCDLCRRAGEKRKANHEEALKSVLAGPQPRFRRLTKQQADQHAAILTIFESAVKLGWCPPDGRRLYVPETSDRPDKDRVGVWVNQETNLAVALVEDAAAFWVVHAAEADEAWSGLQKQVRILGMYTETDSGLFSRTHFETRLLAWALLAAEADLSDAGATREERASLLRARNGKGGPRIVLVPAGMTDHCAVLARALLSQEPRFGEYIGEASHGGEMTQPTDQELAHRAAAVDDMFRDYGQQKAKGAAPGNMVENKNRDRQQGEGSDAYSRYVACDVLKMADAGVEDVRAILAATSDGGTGKIFFFPGGSTAEPRLQALEQAYGGKVVRLEFPEKAAADMAEASAVKMAQASPEDKTQALIRMGETMLMLVRQAGALSIDNPDQTYGSPT